MDSARPIPKVHVPSWGHPAVLRAIEIAGGGTKLARLLQVDRAVIDSWRRRRVPANQVINVEKATGGKVGRHELRPDLYPPEDYEHLRARGANDQTAA